jgi:hypothetical protein
MIPPVCCTGMTLAAALNRLYMVFRILFSQKARFLAGSYTGTIGECQASV